MPNANTTTVPDSSPAFDQVAAAVYINQGPSFDGLNTSQFYNNLLGVPMSFEIYQSINGMFRYGFIMFEDKLGIRETLPLTGNEILSLKYANAAMGTAYSRQPRTMHFNVYDIEEIQFSGSEKDRFTQKALKFHVIEAPFFLKYNTNVWLKSYGTPEDGVTIDTIINQHLTTDLQIPGDLFQLNIQKMSTTNTIHFCVPAWRSQMIFNYLLQYVRDQNDYGNVKFYNTSDASTGSVITNLQSVNNMFMNQKITEFVMVDTTAYSSGQKPTSLISQRALNLILSYKFLSYNITSLASGLPGAHLLNLDYENSQYFTMYDNYVQSNANSKYFYNFSLWSNEISNSQSKRLFIGPTITSLAKAYLNNKIIDHKYQLRCEVATYIDETINPGDKIAIFFMSGMADLNQQHLLDEQLSGGWIVEEIIDSAVNGQGYRKMILIKDSFFNIYDTTAGNNTNTTLPQVQSIIPPNGPTQGI